MKNITARIVLAAMIMVLSRYSAGAPAPQQSQDKANVQSMTVAELEKAADLARARKDYDQAILYFQTALRKDRKNSVLYNKLGLAQLKNNDLRAARLSFESAFKLNPKSADAVNNIGAVDYVNKNYGAAAKHFKKAVALDETHATFHMNLVLHGLARRNWSALSPSTRGPWSWIRTHSEQESRAGVVAQISSPEERARYSYMLAKIYAKRGDVDDACSA